MVSPSVPATLPIVRPRALRKSRPWASPLIAPARVSTWLALLSSEVPTAVRRSWLAVMMAALTVAFSLMAPLPEARSTTAVPALMNWSRVRLPLVEAASAEAEIVTLPLLVVTPLVLPSKALVSVPTVRLLRSLSVSVWAAP